MEVAGNFPLRGSTRTLIKTNSRHALSLFHSHSQNHIAQDTFTMVAENRNDDMASSPETPSSCPVIARGDGQSKLSAESQSEGVWNRFFSRSNDVPQSSSTDTAASACPAKGINAIPASIEEAAKHSQYPSPDQKIPLSTQREISSIPRGDESDTNEDTKLPSHQPSKSSNWMYPSEQQFYNAMLKKGYRPPIESIPDVLRIHNAVNERSWSQVCKWEKELHGNTDPKLVKFVGRPKDLSPKAWFNSRILFTQEPFDRHDWYVDAGDGEPRRYVIDFYEGKEKTGDVTSLIKEKGQQELIAKPPSMYIDARPALDNPSAALDRMIMALRETLPGIASVYDGYKLSSAPSMREAAADVGVKSTSQTEEQSS
jgi:cytochrome c heme-lyase